MIWVIVLKPTITNLDAPELLSDFAFSSQEQCVYALNGEPHSDRATCRPLRAVPEPNAEEPKGEKVDP